MRDVTVILQSGETLCGPLWTWRPVEGWFSLAGEDTRRINLSDVVKATTHGWLPGGLIGEIDLKLRAQREGWQQNGHQST